MNNSIKTRECVWHDAKVALPEEDKEVIVLYDNGYLCFNHRPKLGGYLVRPNGEKIPYKPLVGKDGWCEFSHSLTKGHEIVLWTENPMEGKL